MTTTTKTTLRPFPRFLLTYEANDPETGRPTGDEDLRHCIDPDAPVQTLCGLVADGEVGEDEYMGNTAGASLPYEYDHPEGCEACDEALEVRVRAIMEGAGYAVTSTGGGCMAWFRQTQDGGHVLICTTSNRLYAGPQQTADESKVDRSYTDGWLVGRYSHNGAFLNFSPIILGEALAVAEVLPDPDGHELEGTVSDARPWIVRALAERFSKVLRAWLTPEQMNEVRRRNGEADAVGSSACHSHDFCDANMAINEAWASIYGADFLDMADVPGGDRHTGLLNRAWDLARACGFRLGATGDHLLSKGARLADEIVGVDSLAYPRAARLIDEAYPEDLPDAFRLLLLAEARAALAGQTGGSEDNTLYDRFRAFARAWLFAEADADEDIAEEAIHVARYGSDDSLEAVVLLGEADLTR